MRIIIALPFYGPLGLIYAVLATAMAPLFMAAFIGVLKSAGMSTVSAIVIAMSITFFSLAASPINIVLYTYSRRHYVPVVDHIVVFGIAIPIPRVAMREEKSILAINVGGAVIPAAVALYLLPLAKPATALAVAAASIVIYASSRVVPNVGVLTPAFIPPVVSSTAAVLAGGGPVDAYITAVFSTIMGADLLNLRKVFKQSPPFVSIGGAGVFDGIFLSGVMATMLAILV